MTLTTYYSAYYAFEFQPEYIHPNDGPFTLQQCLDILHAENHYINFIQDNIIYSLFIGDR